MLGYWINIWFYGGGTGLFTVIILIYLVSINACGELGALVTSLHIAGEQILGDGYS